MSPFLPSPSPRATRSFSRSRTWTCPSSTRATTMWKLLDPRSTAATERAGAGNAAQPPGSASRLRKVFTNPSWRGAILRPVSRKKVLVVDDEKDLVDILAFNLRREQYDVLTAPDGERALDVARREAPDLVVLDLMMPGIGGLEVCRRLRGEP